MPRWVRRTYVAIAAWLVLAALRNAFWPGLELAPLSNRFVHVGVLLLAAGLCAVRAARGDRERAAWGLIAAGILAWTAGEAYYASVLWTVEVVPFPSAADVGFLLAPPLLLAGLILLARSRHPRLPATAWADGLTAALATAAFSAALVVDAAAGSASGDPAGVATTLAYPLWDLVLGAFVVGVVAGAGWRSDRTWLVAGAGIATFWIADSLYVVQNATDSFVSPSWFDAGWWIGLTCLSFAAWTPARPAGADRTHRGIRLILGPLVFSAAGLGLLVYGALERTNGLVIALAAASILAVMARLVLTFNDNLSMLSASREEALKDALTGLPNRRALTRGLQAGIARATPERPVVLALFDLDGFKAYNDAFGHPAGDALLERLGSSLQRYLRGRGTAFRMGGDEFCAIFEPGDQIVEPIVAGAASTLSERGEGFDIGCSWGSIVLPLEAEDADTALRLADRRMYAHKHGGRTSAGRQTKDVLLRVLAERNPVLTSHMHDVAELADRTCRELALPDEERADVVHAAELHDVGKVAIPDAILDKPGPLDSAEWEFMRRHTLIGERIIAAAPALQRVAQIVRSSHERWDGQGYPDQLAGEAIPLGARVVAVADAFDAMVTERPYAAAQTPLSAIAELRRCAGSQFDPVVVEAFRAAMDRQAAVSAAG